MTFTDISKKVVAGLKFLWQFCFSIIQIPAYLLILAGIFVLFITELFKSGTAAVENIKVLVSALKQQK